MLIELSVVLVADSNNPSILNPDFLHYNKIVDEGYEVLDSPISTPGFSQVAYKNGITVTSAPDRVVFTQGGIDLDPKVLACPEIAKRYLEHIPHVPYISIGINPKSFVPIQDEDYVLKMLREEGSWMSFKDSLPIVQLKAKYEYSTRNITLDTSVGYRKENDETIMGIIFHGNIHRDLPKGDVNSGIIHLRSILDKWESDMDDFSNLTEKYYG